jgi:hypothetical protein
MASQLCQLFPYETSSPSRLAWSWSFAHLDQRSLVPRPSILLGKVPGNSRGIIYVFLVPCERSSEYDLVSFDRLLREAFS